ncbi:hypothetical protein LCGC14_2370040, partial [marine sediment metagenome]
RHGCLFVVAVINAGLTITLSLGGWMAATTRTQASLNASLAELPNVKSVCLHVTSIPQGESCGHL